MISPEPLTKTGKKPFRHGSSFPEKSEERTARDEERITTDSGSGHLEDETTLLLPRSSDSIGHEDDPDELQIRIQEQVDYRQENRFIILFLVAVTPLGVKFFKAAQSSFEEYLMQDPNISMSATTYSFMLSLMSMPLTTLIGGAMLDYKAKENGKDRKEKQKNCFLSCCLRSLLSRKTCLGTARGPSYSAIFFLGVTLLGIVVYGYGLETENSIPIGLLGATIFGLGEGCVVVASRTFVAHAFYGSDGAFAQGVLVAMNNLAMMASKISLPWLIEKKKQMNSQKFMHHFNFDCLDDDCFAFDPSRIEADPSESGMERSNENENNIWIGVLACCVVQLVSLVAGVLYAWWFGLVPVPRNLQKHAILTGNHPPRKRKRGSIDDFKGSNLYSRFLACLETLPTTFWIVALGRGIFVVVFKVFTRNSNSILMEKFGVSAIAAGRKSSFHELFALGSPVVGLIAYRSPGGIVPVLLFASALASISIAVLACLPAKEVQHYLPGGALCPMIGISIAHGIFIPVCMAIIPQTCSPEHLGMAFAVVEVLGSIFNLTNILFGWLRDATGTYEAPMEMLLLYTIVGMFLLWKSRNQIALRHPTEECGRHPVRDEIPQIV